MSKKIKLAVNWAGACGGCDVSLLDLGADVLGLTSVADIVYWPVAMDFKRKDLEAFGQGEIDVGIFNGAIRTSEHAEDARLLRDRCKVLVAYGACAAFGGIPGLANLYRRTEILETAYLRTASTENPESILPETRTTIDGHLLELPAFREAVEPLARVVEVDYVVPGCPPPGERVVEVVQMIIELARSGSLPPRGTVIASDQALCEECPRNETRTSRRMATIHRPHEVLADPALCFLEQGLLCLGIVTRGGCGGTCIGVNMPCRGCFGPPPGLHDPGAEALSSIGSIAAQDQEDELLASQRLAPVRSLADVAGTFYRFTLPSATVCRFVDEAD